MQAAPAGSAGPRARRDLHRRSCRAAGAQGCRWKTRTTSEEELLARVTEHTRTVHGVSAVNGTLTNYARLVARMPRAAG